MQNAFEALGLAPVLVIGKDEVNAAFRDAGKSVHPDAGGEGQSFEDLQKAYETISSPSKRLKHWLEIRGVDVNTRGTIDTEMMDLFSKVGEVTQKAEALIRKKDEAKSALGLAMLEGEIHMCREAVEGVNRLIESAIGHECASFGELEKADVVDESFASVRIRNLIFLEKWQSTMRGLFSRLV